MKEKLVELPLTACCCHVHPWLQVVFTCIPGWVHAAFTSILGGCTQLLSLSCVGHLFPIKLQLGAVSAHSNTTDAFSM